MVKDAKRGTRRFEVPVTNDNDNNNTQNIILYVNTHDEEDQPARMAYRIAMWSVYLLPWLVTAYLLVTR